MNIHERVIPASVDAVGRMIDTLGSAGDGIWPTGRWPALTLDRPLQVGATGGHGPIRYRVVTVNGEDMLSCSGYLLRKRGE